MLPIFLNSNVLVVGDIILDRYWYGVVNKISAEAPAPVVEVDTIINQPGGAANVAVNIAALGGQSRLIGLTGVDEALDILKKRLLEFKVIFNLVSICTYSTVIKLRVMSHNRQLIRLDFEKNNDCIDHDLLIKQVKLHLPDYKVLVLSDYNKGSLDQIEEIIKLARAMNMLIIVDPKGIQFSRYRGATILTPNILEFESVVGFCKNESILNSRAKEVIADYDLSALLITRAEQGMTLFKRNENPLYFSTQAREVYDVTGAGDTVIAVLSAALSIGLGLERSCFLSNLAAGLVIKKIGTATINTIEMKNLIHKHESCNIPFGVLDEKSLKYAISLVKLRGEKIVMTNGVFDILHCGHISYLNDARKLGDKLVVAVNSDESTKRLKGEKRPVNTLEKRMFILAALSVVDWVVPFYEDTPSRLIKEISPDFLVKGGDYKVNEIDGNIEVLSKGGKVCVLDFKNGYSSSQIINAINDIEK